MRRFTHRMTPYRTIALAALGASGLVVLPSSAALAAPPMGPTAYASAVITPSSGGTVSAFGITAKFQAGAVSSDSLAIITNWPSGLDVPSSSGPVLKTFGLQICSMTSNIVCSNVMGNYPDSTTSGTERIGSSLLSYGPYVGQSGVPGITFGSKLDKLVTISVSTAGTKVYIYDPNQTSATGAYPSALPSAWSDGVLTFQTFQPIVWAVTTPAS
ncbi:MAG: hypothetical protein ACP5OV_05995 [Acidimicrobiales bacterium]